MSIKGQFVCKNKEHVYVKGHQQCQRPKCKTITYKMVIDKEKVYLNERNVL